MNQKSRELDIESLKTPKGDVPTVKGLEAVINLVFSEYSKIENNLNSFQKKIDTFSSEIKNQTALMLDLSKNFSDLIVILGNLERKIAQQRSLKSNNRLIETIDLLTLKEDLSQILSKLEALMTINER